jgi:glutaredoxin 3
VADSTVTMYTTGWCPFCARARALFERKGISWTEVDLESEPARRAEMIERSGGERTVPQIFIGERHIGGADELSELDAAGTLDRLLGRAAG